MHLYAALVPPRDVLERVSDFAAGFHPQRTPPPNQGPPGRHAGGSGRLFGRRRERGAAPPPPTGPLLDLVPPARMHIPIAKFGNLALIDATRLTDAIEAQAAGWASPRLHLSGGVALEPEGDNSVWVELGGDVDALNALTHGVVRTAQGLQLFVDRRAFRPHLQLGTINERTTAEYLEQLVAELQDYQGPSWWQANVILAIPADHGPDQPTYRIHRDIKLGPAVEHCSSVRARPEPAARRVAPPGGR